MSETKEYLCTNAQRLDLFLAMQLEESRSQVANLIKQANVSVDEKLVTRSGVKLKGGEKVSVKLPAMQEQKALDVSFDVEILYEDEAVLVINKPSGVTVHPAPSVKEATLVDWLKHKGVRLSTLSGEERNGIVHRLDKGTSGAMVVAKTNEAHQLLSEQLQDKSMGRYYLAVVNPPLRNDMQMVESTIARSPNNRLKMANTPHGKYAKTMFHPLALSLDEKNQLIACKLFTGRTHQIRVHLESLNRQIIGDPLYGVHPKSQRAERILLHAYIIYFIHPISKKELFFVAGFDEMMQQYITNKFNKEQINEVINTRYVLDSFSTAI